MPLLTKSRYMNGLQCPKLLWIKCNRKDLIPEYKPSAQKRFELGTEVGVWAKKLYQDGVDIPTDDFKHNIEMTKVLLNRRVPLFEPGFMIKNLFSRVDILKPAENNQWDLIEVKSSTKVKPEHIPDVAFQSHCLRSAGLNIRRCLLMHINSDYVRDGDIDPEGLFSMQDVTDAVAGDMQEAIDDMLVTLSKKEMPCISIGKHCHSPYECPLVDYCWTDVPENSVFDLIGTIGYKLAEENIALLRDVPGTVKLNEKQKIQVDCAVSDTVNVNKDGIKEFLGTLEYPIYYFDFETCSSPLPFYQGTKPYQAIPFQYSCHIVKEPGAEPEHVSFLAEGKDDPRPAILRHMKEHLGTEGSIVAYYASFETRILTQLAEAYPEYKEWVESIIKRIVDLIIPFKAFHYYNTEQKGSASLKCVLPAITGEDHYGKLDINNGDDASGAFVAMTFGDMSDGERKKIRDDLEKYCGLDTEGMIWIVYRLVELSK